jgi:hypothetical protein
VLFWSCITCKNRKVDDPKNMRSVLAIGKMIQLDNNYIEKMQNTMDITLPHENNSKQNTIDSKIV